MKDEKTPPTAAPEGTAEAPNAGEARAEGPGLASAAPENGDGKRNQDEKMPLTAHLDELRRRLIVSVIAVLAGFSVSYFFKERLFQVLTQPLKEHLPEGSSLQYIGVPEAFVTYLKLCLFSGLFLAMPVILFEAWRFVSPGLYNREKRYVIPFVLFTSLFFAGGASFCYFVVFPFVFRFFMEFSDQSLRAMPALHQYLGFVTHMIIAFGLVFEMPIIFFFLGRVGLVNYRWLAHQRRVAIVLIFVAAAVLTPGPDVASQLLLAGPLLVLFELSLQVVRITGRKPEPEAESAEQGSQSPAG